jgi:hypothetical protein
MNSNSDKSWPFGMGSGPEAMARSSPLERMQKKMASCALGDIYSNVRPSKPEIPVQHNVVRDN